ncbi:MAG: 2-hydroxyacid dehydrogenase [Patescibacteria group bacterium]
MQITLAFHNPHIESRYRELGAVDFIDFARGDAGNSAAEILVTNSFHPIDKSMLDRMPRLKLIASPTTGLDHIDTRECAERGITILSLQGAAEFLKSIPSVAELTVWFMLELLREPHRSNRVMGNQLKGKCLGIWGMGRIGTHVRRRVSAFEARVIGGDTDRDGDITLRELLEQSDIFSIHVPLTEETDGMITEEYLRLMKPTALLINTARAQIIERSALCIAIRERWIAGYGTDVARDDQEMHDLKKLRQEGFNVVLTQHIGGYTREAREATDLYIFERVAQYVGQSIK